MDPLNPPCWWQLCHRECANIHIAFWVITRILVKLVFEIHHSCFYISHSWIPLYLNKNNILTLPWKLNSHSWMNNKRWMQCIREGLLGLLLFYFILLLGFLWTYLTSHEISPKQNTWISWNPPPKKKNKTKIKTKQKNNWIYSICEHKHANHQNWYLSNGWTIFA